jgi:hypothetical protein
LVTRTTPITLVSSTRRSVSGVTAEGVSGQARIRSPSARTCGWPRSCPCPTSRSPGPDGTYPEGPGAEVQNQTQLLQLVALGRTTVILPDSNRAHLREGLAAVPVLDASPVTTLIAWPPHSRSRALADLVRVAAALRPVADRAVPADRSRSLDRAPGEAAKM